VDPNYQVSSKSVNRKWVNGRRQTNRQTRWLIIRVA